ncbi:hypothetical protein FOA52_013360 [Chlamydomonas sp. UWO 241]|nr:hypothetical protein FOA52_013360 [Chlamydomonas sp. UWO 241]
MSGKEHIREDLPQGHSSGLVARQNAVARPFASGGALLQLGGFQRSFLDFTRVLAKADLGCTAPRQFSASGRGGPLQAARHPAFALEGSGVWHALTLSCCQQLLGPVRVVADFRFALESGVALEGGGAHALMLPAAARPGARRGGRRERAGGLVRHVAAMRPSLLEATYGLDVALPGTSGLARLVAWCAPGRREGMIEMRLF